MTRLIQFRAFAAIGAAGLLAACSAENDARVTNEPPEAVANGATPDAAVASNELTPAASAVSPEANFMLGKWSAVDEDCSITLEFRKNGEVTSPVGEGRWTMTGDKLTIDHGDGSKPTTTTIEQLGPDRIQVTMASGRSESQKRC